MINLYSTALPIAEENTAQGTAPAQKQSSITKDTCLQSKPSKSMTHRALYARAHVEKTIHNAA